MERINPKTLSVAIWNSRLSNYHKYAAWLRDGERVGTTWFGAEIERVVEVKVPDGVYLALDDLGRLCGSRHESGQFWLVDPECGDCGELPIFISGMEYEGACSGNSKTNWWRVEMEAVA